MKRDALYVAPYVYKLVEENERVRVLEARGKPGDLLDMHSHPECVTIFLTDCKFQFTYPDGRTAEAEIKAGEAGYSKAFEHSVKIVGSSEAHFFVVELK
jgi:beta-alanine degradation protein BauB